VNTTEIADSSEIAGYEILPGKERAVQFNGGNLDKIRELLPEDVTARRAMDATHVIISTHLPDEADRVLGPGMWLSVRDGEVAVHGDKRFRQAHRMPE
jgi:hypothetical protein